MRTKMTTSNVMGSFLERVARPFRPLPEKKLVLLAAVQSHADRCGLDALLKIACRSCGRETLHTILPDGGYHCFPELMRTDGELVHLLGCTACVRMTAHIRPPKGAVRCIRCWMDEIWRLARNSGTEMDRAVARRGLVASAQAPAHPPHDLHDVS